jgi:LacI family transcriptional regulator
MRRSGRPTIQDIADRCGVSKGTVNRAIHNKAGINEETKRRILAVIKDLGFQPNYHARSLATGKTETIGVLLPNVENEFFAMVCSEIEEMCWQRGYVMNLSFSNDRPDREEAVVRSLLDRSVDGMIVFPVSRDDRALRSAVDAGVPVVVLLNDLNLAEASSVVVNEYAAMGAMVQHLIEYGHRRFAYIDGYVHYSETYNDYVNRERRRAFVDTVTRNGLQLGPAAVVEFDPRLYGSSDFDLLKTVVDASEPPTALVCFHDQIAIWAVQGLQEMGLRVPGDVSVTGFDDIRELAYIQPRLTTSAIPTKVVAAEALQALFHRLDNSDEPPHRVEIPARLVIGESTAVVGGSATRERRK